MGNSKQLPTTSQCVNIVADYIEFIIKINNCLYQEKGYPVVCTDLQYTRCITQRSVNGTECFQYSNK